MMSGYCSKAGAAEHTLDAPASFANGSLFSTGVAVGAPVVFSAGTSIVDGLFDTRDFPEDSPDRLTKESQLVAFTETHGTILDNLYAGQPVRVPFPNVPVSFGNPRSHFLRVQLPDTMTKGQFMEAVQDEDNLAADGISYKFQIPKDRLVRLFGMEGQEGPDGYKVVLLTASIVEQTALPISVSVQLFSNKGGTGGTRWFSNNHLAVDGSGSSTHTSYIVPADGDAHFHDSSGSGKHVYCAGGHTESLDWRRWATCNMEGVHSELVAMGQPHATGRVTVLTFNQDRLKVDTIAEYFLLTQFHIMQRMHRTSTGPVEPTDWIVQTAANGLQIRIPEKVMLARLQVITHNIAPHRTLFYLNDVSVHITPLNQSKGWTASLQEAFYRKVDAQLDLKENVDEDLLRFGITFRFVTVPVTTTRKVFENDVELVTDSVDVVE